MASIHSAAGPCFLGASRVKMADGTQKRCDEIQPGDRDIAGYTIRCVVKTLVPYADIVRLNPAAPEGGFTLWHPVFVNDKWQHPADLGHVERVTTDAIYNFVLDEGHILIIDGIMTCTMGHDFTGPVIEHSYFGQRVDGQRNILDDLQETPGWTQGYITWKNVRVSHDAQSGFINGMKGESV
jgi:hypothetical protein